MWVNLTEYLVLRLARNGLTCFMLCHTGLDFLPYVKMYQVSNRRKKPVNMGRKCGAMLGWALVESMFVGSTGRPVCGLWVVVPKVVMKNEKSCCLIC